VDAVTIGAALAPIVSSARRRSSVVSAPAPPPAASSRSRCRRARRTARRRRWTSAASWPWPRPTRPAADVRGHDARRRSDAHAPRAPAAPLVVSGTGRYLLVRGVTKTMVVDLAREQVAAVDGLAAKASSPSRGRRRPPAAGGDGERQAAGRQLTGFPTLAAAPVAGAPATAAVVDVPAAPAGLVAGLHPHAASGEGSLWVAAFDLKAFAFAQQGGNPLLLGAARRSPAGPGQRRRRAGAARARGSTPQLALLTAADGKVTGEGSGAASGALGVVIAAGGAQVALATDGATPALSYAGVSGGALAEERGARRQRCSARCSRCACAAPGRVAALVGPKPRRRTLRRGALSSSTSPGQCA